MLKPFFVRKVPQSSNHFGCSLHFSNSTSTCSSKDEADQILFNYKQQWNVVSFNSVCIEAIHVQYTNIRYLQCRYLLKCANPICVISKMCWSAINGLWGKNNNHKQVWCIGNNKHLKDSWVKNPCNFTKLLFPEEMLDRYDLVTHKHRQFSTY